jgi:maltooligosyltrehalose trehalohydrolase
VVIFLFLRYQEAGVNIGAHRIGPEICEWVVWAPRAGQMDVVLTSPEGRRVVPMVPLERGYWQAQAKIAPDARYLFRLDQRIERPDPVSGLQPEGVHGPSVVVDHAAFSWNDQGWSGLAVPEMLIYELHVGAFSPAGTFEAILPKLDYLLDLGINALEIMPVAACPGKRNWGYDGVYPFAVQSAYGGPAALKKLVDTCHGKGLAVILDVVYNHLGPEGNYLRDFGPYFTEKYHTLWGEAVNFDGPGSDEVRHFFIRNALHWFEHYHLDALRLDAIHGIFDQSACPFLSELAARAEAHSRKGQRRCSLIAESDLNDARVIRPRELGGHGLDAVWCDDFHHALHTLCTGERGGYYRDFGSVRDLAKAYQEGHVYSGQYSAYRGRRFGNSSQDRPARQFVVFTQNHDQVGNRMLGERLSRLVPFETLKLAAAVLLLGPFVPMLFMGEEYGEENPFLYFIDHEDRALADAVRQGRLREFETFRGQGRPPDPASDDTFLRSKLNWSTSCQGRHGLLHGYYRRLFELRRSLPALGELNKENLEARPFEPERRLELRRWNGENEIAACFNFSPEPRAWLVSRSEGLWHKCLGSGEKIWGGNNPDLPSVVRKGISVDLPPHSAAVYEKE